MSKYDDLDALRVLGKRMKTPRKWPVDERHRDSALGNSSEPCGLMSSRTTAECAPPSRHGRRCDMCGNRLFSEVRA